MNIRHATADDISNLLPLFDELGYPCTFADLQQRFERFIQNPGYGLAVYDWQNKIVGFIAWSKSDLIVKNATRLHIEGLVVKHDFRGKGIGKQLMDFMENIAAQQKPVIIDLTSSMRRSQDGSHQFYKNLGYCNEGSLAKLYLRKQL